MEMADGDVKPIPGGQRTRGARRVRRSDLPVPSGRRGRPTVSGFFRFFGVDKSGQPFPISMHPKGLRINCPCPPCFTQDTTLFISNFSARVPDREVNSLHCNPATNPLTPTPLPSGERGYSIKIKAEEELR